MRNEECLYKEEPEIVIGETVIPKLEIGKKTQTKNLENEKEKKEERQTIKK